MKTFILYLFIINILSFMIMFIDKTLAILRKYRISERFLFLCALLLGALGIYIGMFVFRHKTKPLQRRKPKNKTTSNGKTIGGQTP